MTPRKPKVKLCGAKTRSGKPCKRGAGAGTERPGFGRCKLHGGATPSGKQAAAKERAVELAALLIENAPPTDPHEAILLCLASAMAEWRFWESQMRDMSAEELTDRPRSEVAAGKNGVIKDLRSHEQYALAMRLRNDARDKARLYAKDAALMGVEERRVQIVEQIGGAIVQVLQGVLGDLRLTKDQLKRAPQIVHHHLQLLEGGRA